jgi:hypothetical protein
MSLVGFRKSAIAVGPNGSEFSRIKFSSVGDQRIADNSQRKAAGCILLDFGVMRIGSGDTSKMICSFGFVPSNLRPNSDAFFPDPYV